MIGVGSFFVATQIQGLDRNLVQLFGLENLKLKLAVEDAENRAIDVLRHGQGSAGQDEGAFVAAQDGQRAIEKAANPDELVGLRIGLIQVVNGDHDVLITLACPRQQLLDPVLKAANPDELVGMRIGIGRAHV